MCLNADSSLSLDAANDCHSGLTIYNVLSPLVETINPKPLPAYYSFDVFQGYPYQPTASLQPAMLWQPHNPFYDPGPLPPPKPPKPPKTRKPQEGVSTTGASGTQATALMLPPQIRTLPMRPSSPISETVSAIQSSDAQRTHQSFQGPPMGSRVSNSQGSGWRAARGLSGYGPGRGRGRAMGFFISNSMGQSDGV
jgi:hypothetical protein